VVWLGRALRAILPTFAAIADAGSADGVADDSRRTNARAARKQYARENRKKKSRVFHYATVVAEYQTAAALKRELLYRLAVEAFMEQKCGSHMVFAHDASAGNFFAKIT
jgi:hypothetical protein